MKIVVVGGSGLIGAAVVRALGARGHEVIVASRHCARRIDIEAPASVRAFFASIGKIDALVSCAGSGKFGPLDALTDDDFAYSVNSKLMGQVNLVRFGHSTVADRGSITLTTGVLAREPIPGGATFSLVNGGVEAFARAAQLELARGLRVNVVSPPWISETLTAMGRDPSGGIPAADAAKAYVEAVEGARRGEILDARLFR